MGKRTIVLGLILLAMTGPGCQNSNPPEISPALEFNVGAPMQQFRFVPVQMSNGSGFLVIHSNHPNIDPYHRGFTLPTDTLKVSLFSNTGKRIWARDLGPGMIPGLWFCPVLPFDLDGDGVDEIYLVNNSDPEHPLHIEKFVLERISANSGQILDLKPWPTVNPYQTNSHLFRNFINAGFSKGRRRLITAQGTYGPLQLQCWDESLNQIWSRTIKLKKVKDPGARGSHMFPVLDIDGDGRDELFYGERCIDIDTGEDIWVANVERWWGHSDVIQPTLDLTTGRWFIFTCQEYRYPPDPEGVGIVMLDDKGKEVWGYRGMNHVHAGWTARLGDNGEHLCYGLDISGKTATGRTAGYTEHFYDMKGSPLAIPFPLHRTLPVDFDGDGLHELVYTGGENVGNLIDREGEQLAQFIGKPAYAGKILDLPGEQVITWDKDGTVRVYACPDGKDTPAALRRYKHPYYSACLRIWAVGYNKVNLGGL